MSKAAPPFGSLYAFVVVAETGSLAAAAERLNVTQPAVSRRIQRLEAHLGVPLIDRGANFMSLTSAGQDFAAALSHGFRLIQAATDSFGTSSARSVRVRGHHTWALRWLIPRLPRFRSRHPGQEVEVTTTVLSRDFRRDPGDLAVRIADRPPALGATRLSAVGIVPFGTPAMIRRARREGLGGLTLLGSRVLPGHWPRWAAGTGTVLPRQPVLFETTLLAIQAALEGLGLVITSPSLVAEDVRHGRLMPLAGEVVATGRFYWLVMAPGAPGSSVLAFRDWLLEEVAAESGAA